MSRRPRDREAEITAINAAAHRLLTGTPLRSTAGKLTATELIIESGVARDKLYGHKSLVEQFQAQALAQHQTPTAMKALQDKHQHATAKLAELSTELAVERARTRLLRLHIAEQSLELDQARHELEAAADIPRLPQARAAHSHRAGEHGLTDRSNSDNPLHQ